MDHITHTLRTNIELDAELIARAMRLSGARTKRAAVEEGLRLLVRLAEQRAAVADLEGLGWHGDLDASRTP